MQQMSFIINNYFIIKNGCKDSIFELKKVVPILFLSVQNNDFIVILYEILFNFSKQEIKKISLCLWLKTKV